MLRLGIKEVAEQQKVSQKDLAARANVSPQLIHRYWNNYIKSVNLTDLERIARALGVTSKDLLVNEEQR